MNESHTPVSTLQEDITAPTLPADDDAAREKTAKLKDLMASG